MAITELRQKLVNLRNQVLELARESLDEGDSKAYDILVDMAKRLSVLSVPASTQIPPSGGNVQPPGALNLIPVFARYKGQRYDAQFDRSSVNGGRGQCIFFRGEWMTSSGAANLISDSQADGWRFWRYKRSNGAVSKIEDFK